MKYFETHEFGEVPEKFILRIGQLVNAQYIKGITKVLEKWRDIFSNSNKYIYGILVEEPLELIDPLVKKAKSGVKVNSIFHEFTIVPKGRKKLLTKLKFDELLENGQVERKMKKKCQNSCCTKRKRGMRIISKN